VSATGGDGEDGEDGQRADGHREGTCARRGLAIGGQLKGGCWGILGDGMRWDEMRWTGWTG
jgi:hypothetical protein